MSKHKFKLGQQVKATTDIDLWDNVKKGMRGVVIYTKVEGDHTYYGVDFSQSFPGGILYDEDDAFCHEDELEAVE